MAKHGLTSAQEAKLRAALEKKRDELRGVISARVRSTVEADEDDSVEEGDLAERQIEKTQADGVAEVDRHTLGEVERALAKLDAGTYGVSEVSGEPIPLARLEAVPWARANADEEEKRGK